MLEARIGIVEIQPARSHAGFLLGRAALHNSGPECVSSILRSRLLLWCLHLYFLVFILVFVVSAFVRSSNRAITICSVLLATISRHTTYTLKYLTKT